MLSQKARYGIRALAVLAQRVDDQPMLVSDIAEQAQVPKKFLEAILLALKHAGIVQSRKGKGGGYALALDSASVPLGRIIRSLDGPLAPLPCASRTAYTPCEDCPRPESCGLREVLAQVRDAIAEVLDNTSLATFAQRCRELESTTRPEDMFWI